MPPQAYLGDDLDTQMKDEDAEERNEEASSADAKSVQQDDWMANPFMMATYSRDDIRKEKESEKEKEREKNSKLAMDTPGTSVRELNPFWKDGGTGLPEESPSSQKKAPAKAGIGDLGAGWLRKSFQRAKEMAEEQGRSIEDVAADKWGSLEKYYELLAEAEGAERHSTDRRRGSWNRNRDRYGGRSYDRDRDRPRDSYGARDSDRYSRDNHESRDGGSYQGRQKSDDYQQNKDQGRERMFSRDQSRYGNRDASKESSSSRRTFMKPGDDDRHSNDRDADKYTSSSSSRRTFMKPGDDSRSSSDRDAKRDAPSSSSSSSRRTFMKPGGDDRPSSYRDANKYTSSSSSSPGRTFMKPSSDDDRSASTSSSLRDYKSMFKKPGDDSSSASMSHGRGSSSSASASVLPSWKKAAFKKPGELDNIKDRTSDSKASGTPAWKKSESRTTDSKEDDRSRTKKRHSSSSSDSSGSSSSSSSEGEDESDKRRKRSPTPPPPPPPVKLLSESEMNQLGAKIVKAELMGNEALAQKLKNKLEASRQAKANQPARPASQPGKMRRDAKDEGASSGDDEVILTRTDRSGQSWPLPDRTVPAEMNTGRRKKKQKVVTHGKSGQRERYFGDDDELDLKTLVQREKMSSAEDQQKVFARMAAKSMDKINMDYTLDDMFVSSAAKQESKAQTEERERSKAIAEHRRLAASLSKCPMCIDSPDMKKHLIIALGMKVYLCLPATKPLTDGHCLIIPMQHSIASTGLDEDVWNEVQIFRKGLTKMFEDHDQDAIFLETCMNPKKQRHMCIECVPVPKETGDLAPIYFKKAIQESESEWMQNKKLIDTRNKGLRKSVPTGFPYFSVDFGLDGGFAHIIEDEQLFPHYFGKEIIGGMMDVEPMLWRRPHKQNFKINVKKVLQFADWWKPFDWTQKLKDNGTRW
ncbi:CWF19-like protein 2 isoform X2 [Amphiura filiformis]|uniref:CWF19-like protein 2 isoform X2 n=1 Tax=Amphiura filiformis TaxID=82378 RepID=UPI003B218DB8